jgi:hypothetical protein
MPQILPYPPSACHRPNEFDDELVHGFVLSVPVGIIAALFQERSRNGISTAFS